MRLLLALVLLCHFGIFSISFVSKGWAQAGSAFVLSESSQQAKPSSLQQKKNKANRNVLGLITGDVAESNVQIGADLSAVVSGKTLRIVPIIGQGARRNIEDLLYLRSADIAIVQNDVLDYFHQSGKYGDLKQKLRYIAKLYHDEVHIIAGKGIKSLEDLSGKKVNFGLKDSGSFITSTVLFDRFKINVSVTNYDQNKALKMLKSGDISAMIYVAGKPASLLDSVSVEDGLHILPISYDPVLYQTYFPSSFSSKDYPALVAKGKRVSTLASSSIMIVYNWSTNSRKYKLISRFVERFFDKRDEFLQASHHPKWKEFSLGAKILGWTKFKGAYDKIRALKENVKVSKLDGDLQKKFDEFLKSQKVKLKDLNDEQKNALFSGFISWAKKK